MKLGALLLGSLITFTGLAQAQDTPVPADDAETVVIPNPAEVAEDVNSNRLELSFGDYFQEQTGRSIADEISIDLIDLDELYEAIETRGAEDVLKISVQDCIDMALQQNPDILISAIDPEMSEADIFSSKGEFDPVLQARYQKVDAEQSLDQQQVAFSGGISSVTQISENFNATLSGRVQTGTTYSLNFVGNKETSTFGGFIPEFDTSLSLQLTQPLLKGFGLKYNKVRINSARNNKKISEAQLRLTVMNTVSEVLKAYWDLVGAVENLRVREESLTNAERLLSISSTQREIGTAADIEVLQSKAGVAARQSDYVTARAAIGDSSDRLKQLLDMRVGEQLSKVQLLPLDRPTESELDRFDINAYDELLNESQAKAIQNRPEIEMMELQLTNAGLEVYRTKKDMLPQLDLTGSLTHGGRAPTLDDAFKGLRKEETNVFTYGVTGQVSLGNRSARGQHMRAKLTQEQVERQREQTKNGLLVNTSVAVRNTYKNKTLVESSRQTMRLQEANVAAEESRLRLGVTTSWQVLQVQEDLTTAQTQEVQALVAFAKTVIDLSLSEGTLLETLNIDFSPATSDTKRPGYFGSLVPRWK